MIAQWDYVEENFDGRNRLRFEIARRAARTDYGYTAAEVEDFLGAIHKLPAINK